MKHDDGGPARNALTNPAVTWLDAAAMHALTGLLLHRIPEPIGDRSRDEVAAVAAYDYAAALLREKCRREQEG